MSEADRAKWNERHRDGYAAHGQPTPLLVQWIDRIPRGRALDLACGSGRNALYLAAAGFTVDAVDISNAALAIGRGRARAAGLQLNWIEQDLDEPLAESPDGPLTLADGYALVLVVRFTDLPLIRQLTDKLAPGGMLVTEQHIVTDAVVGGPSDPAFRLQPGALRAVAEGLRILFYEEGIVDDPMPDPAPDPVDGAVRDPAQESGRRPMALARLVAQKPAATV